MLKQSVADFLSQKRIAVAGVSRNAAGKAANAIYDKLRQSGYEVFAVNPNTVSIQGSPCFPDLQSLPEKVDGVVIVTRPAATLSLVKACIRQGIPRVWMHRSFGPGSVSEEAVALAEENGLTVIAGGCPMMFCKPVDVPHRCMRWFLTLARKLPD